MRSLEVAIWGYADVPHAEAALRRQLEKMVEVEGKAEEGKHKVESWMFNNRIALERYTR